MTAHQPAQFAETARDWHGWSRGGVALHIGPLPGRKSVCLYTHVGCTIEPVAYFRSVDDAQRALNVLDHLLRVAGHGTHQERRLIDGSDG